MHSSRHKIRTTRLQDELAVKIHEITGISTEKARQMILSNDL